MPSKNNMIAGERQSVQIGSGYSKDPMYNLAASFIESAQNIVTESGIELFEGSRALQNRSSIDTLRNFFIEGSCDPDSFETVEDYNAYMEAMGEQFENDRQGLLEYSPIGAFNPIIGITFPMHKNLIMNNVYEAAMEKKVAVSPKFTLTMEYRYLVTPDGQKIDVFRDQNLLTPAINNTVPWFSQELTLPENGTTDIFGLVGGVHEQFDAVSIETYISEVIVDLALTTGEINPNTGEVLAGDETVTVKVPVDIHFEPGYGGTGYGNGRFQRSVMEPVRKDIVIYKPNASGVPTDPQEVSRTFSINTIINGAMHENKFFISAMEGFPDSTITGTTVAVSKVNLKARKDTSNAMIETCSVKWDAITTLVEIAEAVPYNVPISPQEVKDISALYNVNQLTKIMSIIKLVMSNYKDDTIKSFIDDSFERLDPSQKTSGYFSFKPRTGYALDHVEWIHKTFMWDLDAYVTKLMQVLNDPNMTITVFGCPDLVRKITPTEYTYQSPSNIGPVELDFVRTISTSDKRVYQFIGTDKKRWNDDLNIILKPRNSERMIYCLFDYQMYISNEIRNYANPALPAVHAFERFKMYEYQPVQGRITVLDRDGGVGNTPLVP